MSTGSSVSTAASSEDEKKEQRLLDVMFLCDEWKSLKGGLSTFNREFVINLAEITTGSMKIYCYVSKSDDRDREDAKKHGVNLINAETVPGSRDPLDWLKVPPPELQHPHVVIGHGRKLGTPACHIVRAAKCKWIQFVHVFSEDLGKYKKTTTSTIDTIEENEEKHKMEIELCKAADAVVAVGSRLQQKYSRCLLNVKVEIITPGIFGKFSNESKLAVDRSVVKHFNVSMFGRATFEDLSLKGYDIVANAIGPLGKNFELTFVGSSPGEHRKVEQWFLDNTGVSRNQLTIRGYCSDPEELKLMFYQSDLVALPSRTEGFGLVALEAISAGIPILVSGESGVAEALREVEGGNTVIVEFDEDADEWARRIREMAEESAEEREAKARRLRENYREVYSWRTECEKFKGMIEKVVENANDGKLNVKVDVKDLKHEEQSIETAILATESVRGREVQQPRAPVTSAVLGSMSYLQTEQKIFLSIAENCLQTTPPQSWEEHNKFLDYLKEVRVVLAGTSIGSLVMTVKCESVMILEGLWTDYLSGHLGEVVQNSFVTEKILKELNLVELKLKTTIDEEEYIACKVYFEKVALRDALSAQSYSTGTEGEAQLERWKQNTDVVESEKVKSSLPIFEMSTTGHNKEGEEPQETMKGISPLTVSSSSDSDDDSELEGRLKTFTLQEEKCILPPSEEELEELLMKLQSMKGSLSIFEMSTTVHIKEGEEPQETMKDQKLNLKVDVEHVKLADQDTCSTASVSTMEPAECQKASIASGAYRKRPSDTDLEDLQPLEKKVLCLIAMNYLPTTPPEGRDEHSEFQEYLRDMKVHITCVSVGIRLVITVKCDSRKSLEELWEDYSCGLLGKMVRDCFVTEKILKALNLAELKLKTTMDIEDYNACKLYFEKDPLRGTSLSAKLSTAGNGKELEGKLKTLKLQEEKRTWPVPEFSASDPEEELAELRLKLQGMEVTSPSAVYFTTGHEKEKKGTSLSTKLSTVGHGKELEGKLKTMKLQEEKQEPEGLVMKLQRVKGSLPSSPLSTTDLEEKLEEVCVQLMRLRKEGSLAVPKSSTSHVVKKLAELCMELIRLRMEGTLPPPELFTANLEGELKELLHTQRYEEEEEELGVKLYRQRYQGILSTRTFERDVEKLLRQLQEKRMEALENTMYPTIRSGLARFDVSLPEELQSYVSYLFNESAKLGLRKRALHSLSAVEELREAMDEYKLKTFLSIHIREGAWQVALLFMDELSHNKLPRDWFVDLRLLWEDEEMIGSPLYSSTSGILKAWPTEYDPDLVTLCKAITDRDWKVTKLILCRSRISEEGLKNLGTALSQGELSSLALCHSDLQSRGLKHLCEALISGDCSLTSLNVSGNWLGDEDIMHLFTVLTNSNCTLTRLNVSLNRAGDRAVKDLARALTNKNCALTSLDISWNQIGDEGVKYLCKALTDSNFKLRSLDLRGNWKVTDVGIQCLSEAITGTDWEVREGLTLSRSIKSEA